MTVGGALQKFGSVVERLEADGFQVRDVSAPDGYLLDEETVRAMVSVTIPLPEGGDLGENVSVSIERGAAREGEVVVDLSLSAPLETRSCVEDDEERAASKQPIPRGDSTVEDTTSEPSTTGSGPPEGGEEASDTPSDSTADPGTDRDETRASESESRRSDSSRNRAASDGDFTRGVSAAEESADRPAADERATERSGAAVGEDEPETGPTPDEKELPPHRDPEQLQAVYAECDTFAEMTEALGADVTPQTVRHHMIKLGIHEPGRSNTEGSTDTDSETDPESESDAGTGSDTSTSTDASTNEPGASSTRELADEELDDIEASLPGSLSIEDVTAAVESSKTLHQVRRQLGLDVEETRDVLCELNLLDLVTGRLATRPDDNPTAGEITDRIRTALSG